MKNFTAFLLQLCIILIFSTWISYSKQFLIEALLNRKLNELWVKLAAFERETLSARIVGGYVAKSGEFPYMVALRSRTGKLICGGSLLNSQHVLTAAHCVQGVNPSVIRVIMGVEQLTDQSSATERTVAQIWANGGFDFNSFDWDVAVLKLSSPVQIGASIQPICLSTSDHKYSGRQSTVIGWGRKREADRRSSNALRKVNVPIVNGRACQRSYRYFRAITDRMLCAGFRRGGKDSCQGDSGGPMVVKSGSKMMQIGIVSWGNGCARPGYYGVYTRIGKVLSWIKKFTNVQECS